jgi:hypothetical protein
MHDTFCIVAKAVAEQCMKPRLESGIFGHARGEDGGTGLRTRQSAPNERNREIGF